MILSASARVGRCGSFLTCGSGAQQAAVRSAGDAAVGEAPQFIEQWRDLSFDTLLDAVMQAPLSALGELVWRARHDLVPFAVSDALSHTMRVKDG